MVLIFTRVPAPNFRIPRSMTPVQEAPPNLASSVADQTQPTAAEPTAGAHEMSRLTPGKKSLSKGTAVEWAKYRLTEEATVVLHRPDLNTGLGVTLAKYPHDVPHPRIFELSKDGIAARSGLLKVKDVIVAVNGVSVNSDAAAAQVLQLTGLQITFTIRRTPSPLSAHQVHTPVQSGKARLNAAPASTEVTAEPWSEPEQPAYPLQLALASPPQSPTPIAFPYLFAELVMAAFFPVLRLAGRPAVARFAAAALLGGQGWERGSARGAISEDHLGTNRGSPTAFGRVIGARSAACLLERRPAR